MEFKLDISSRSYVVDNPGLISTPQLLVFEDRVDDNIQKMADILGPDFTLDSLCPHVKTHKSIWATHKLMDAGVYFFKATINEVEMLITAGVKKIFIAYPLLPDSAQRVAKLMAEHPEVEIFIQIGHEDHIPPLLEIAKKRNIVWRYYIDLDVGMHRTGTEPAAVKQLYLSFPMEFAGIHAY
ncbi:alanine racemase, partial [candidate division KSB1 bacterium]|nr:alanine racemase [candidate division KSB1 bacterium]